MKILIADDERMVRLSFLSMCEELYPDTHQYWEARNGKELVRLVTEERPDVVFVDIRMPLLDGLNAVEQLTASQPDIYFIILSGYSDFSYAQKAIQLGVRNYLLKPPSLEDIQNVLLQANAEKERKLLDANQSFFYEIMAQFNTYYLLSELETETYGHLSAYLFYADYNEEKGQRQFYKELYKKIQKEVSPLILQGHHYSLFSLPEGGLCLILKSPFKTNLIKRSFERISLDFGITVTVFYAQSSSMEQLFQHIIMFTEQFSLRIFLGYGGIIDKKALAIQDSFQHLLGLAKTIEDLQLAYQEKERTVYQKTLENLVPETTLRPLISIVDWEGVEKYLRHYFYITTTIRDFSGLFQILSQSKETLHNPKLPDNGAHIAEKVKLYLAEHYMEDIGINTLASVYGITPNYLSKLFHQKAGIRFIDYLTKLRIHHGKELLLTRPGLSVNEVAELVGYNSPRHFSKVFQKATGATPSEYRRKAITGE